MTFVQPGNVLTLTAPLGGVVTGRAYVVGGLLVVAHVTAAAGALFSGSTAGVFSLPKVEAQAWAEGACVYWDAANERLDSVPTAGALAGTAAEAAANPSTAGLVRLSGVAQLPILTPEGGIATWLVNKTGAPTVRGQIVTAGGGVSRGAVKVPAGVPNAVGTFYDSGVADGALARVVTTGVAPVLFADGQAPTVGYWVGSSDAVDGRARTQQVPPGAGLVAEIEAHNAEIGHCLESLAAGADVVALCVLHFN
jgi:predicted RecA/RadA family phage recombinase